MKMTNPTISQALEEFDKKFVIKKGWEIGQVAFKDKPKSMIWKEVGGNPKQLRAFLQSKLEEAVRGERERIKVNIGFLRQWLNEDRITDKPLVTNEQIELWLFEETK